MPRNNPGQQRARPPPEGPNRVGLIAAGVGIPANNDGRHRHEPGRDTLMTHTARTIGLNGRREEADLNDLDDSQEYQGPALPDSEVQAWSETKDALSLAKAFWYVEHNLGPGVVRRMVGRNFTNSSTRYKYIQKYKASAWQSEFYTKTCTAKWFISWIEQQLDTNDADPTQDSYNLKSEQQKREFWSDPVRWNRAMCLRIYRVSRQPHSAP
jgi:hypothetical protein